MADTKVETGKFAAYKSATEQVYTEDNLKTIGRHAWKHGKVESDGAKRMLFSDLGITWRQAHFVDTIENWQSCRKTFIKAGKVTLRVDVEHGKDWSYIRVAPVAA